MLFRSDPFRSPLLVAVSPTVTDPGALRLLLLQSRTIVSQETKVLWKQRGYRWMITVEFGTWAECGGGCCRCLALRSPIVVLSCALCPMQARQVFFRFFFATGERGPCRLTIQPTNQRARGTNKPKKVMNATKKGRERKETNHIVLPSIRKRLKRNLLPVSVRQLQARIRTTTNRNRPIVGSTGIDNDDANAVRHIRHFETK